MELKALRKPAYTMTIDGRQMRLRCDLNALDYLERSCGGLKNIGPHSDIRTQKHMVRAFLLCNYPENAKILDSGNLDDLKPSLWQIGEWFDSDTIQAVTTELFKIALESTASPEDENSLGESMVGVALEAIGALSRLCGRRNLEEAFRIFGTAPHGKF